MVHNMRNDYRVGRKVLHCVVDEWLHDRVCAAALVDGVSITAFVSRVLEEVTCGGVGVGSGDSVVFGAKSGVVGSHSAGGSGSGPVGGVVGRTVDWDSILVAGSKPVLQPAVLDPIEDIA
jgi:ABC-type transporter Mla maintaining outer membrane lipid asymmetry permease subunit MlaE